MGFFLPRQIITGLQFERVERDVLGVRFVVDALPPTPVDLHKNVLSQLFDVSGSFVDIPASLEDDEIRY